MGFVRRSPARGMHACTCLAAALAQPACFYDTRQSVGHHETTGASTSTTSPAPEPVTTTGSVDHATTTSTTSTDVSTSTSTSPATSTTDATTTGCTEQPWFADADADGIGVADEVVMACEQPAGYTAVPGDCAPMDPTIAPDKPELCDAIDNDCDGSVDEYSPMNTACNGCTTTLVGDRVFYLCTTMLSWQDARAACLPFGAQLATIHSQAEHDALVPTVTASMTPWWIGLDDLAAEGTFTWIDLTPVNFTAWGAAEPNDVLMNEDCAQYVLTGAWNDADCASPIFSICAGPL